MTMASPKECEASMLLAWIRKLLSKVHPRILPSGTTPESAAQERSTFYLDRRSSTIVRQYEETLYRRTGFNDARSNKTISDQMRRIEMGIQSCPHTTRHQ